MDESTNKLAFNKAAKGEAKIYEGFAKRGKKQMKSSARYQQLKSEQCFSVAPKTNNEFSVMSFDVEEFLHHFDGIEISEEEKVEVLNALWQIMCRFVEIGFGLDSHSLACEQKQTDSRNFEQNLIDSDHTDNEEK